MNTKQIRSLKDLQLRMPDIIREYGSNNNFTQIALANPIIAMERAGFEFTEIAKDEIENYTRFGREGLDKLHVLKENIFKHTGRQFDLNNAEKLTDVLIGILPQSHETLNQTMMEKESDKQSITVNRNDLFDILKNAPHLKNHIWHDELLPYDSLHPVIPLLIEYRKLQTENPRFTSYEQISMVESKLKNSPIKNVVFNLHQNT